MDDLRRELAASLEKFRLEKMEPLMAADEEAETFRMDIYQGLGKLGICGMGLLEEHGGTDLGLLDFSAALGEVAKSSVAYAVTVSVSSMVARLIQTKGTAEQKKRLPDLAAGEAIAAFCLSESAAGSDAAALQTRAVKGDGGYVLNGAKMWISSAGIARHYLVMARTGKKGAAGVSAFLVDEGTCGLSFGKREKKMGWRVSPTREVLLRDCFVPREHLLGPEGEGLEMAMGALNRGRVTIGAIAVGLARRALQEALAYSQGRRQFSQRIFDFQGIRWMLADMATEVAASCALVERAARLCDSGKDFRQAAAMAKLKATDSAMRVTTDAVQIFGGVGHTLEYPVARLMGDAKILQIVEGSNQIQRAIIASELARQCP